MGKPLVLFDCDGVLINTEEIGYYVLVDMLAGHGLTYSREDYVQMLLGVRYDQFIENIRAHYLKTKGVALPDNFEEELRKNFKAAEKVHLEAIEGVKELLMDLRRAGIPYAVCSNSGSDSLEYKLKMGGLYDYFFPDIYSKDDVANAKPYPDMYEKAAADKGCRPEDCIVIEDSVTGTMAGKAAGMYVIGFMGEAHREPVEADMLRQAGARDIAHHMNEVRDKIFAKFGLQRVQRPNPGL